MRERKGAVNCRARRCEANVFRRVSSTSIDPAEMPVRPAEISVEPVQVLIEPVQMLIEPVQMLVDCVSMAH